MVWTGAGVVGLNPEDGSEYWRVDLKPSRMPIGIATPVVDGDRLFVVSFYDGSMMIRLKQDSPGAEMLWHKTGRDEIHTQALQGIISTPIFDGDHIYGVDSYGELRCLDANTGERIWEDLTAVPKNRWATIHFIRHEDKYWLFNERGELIIADLTPQGFKEISRTKLIEPTTVQLERRGEGVAWAHPAFANRHVLARSDKEIVCASLEARAENQSATASGTEAKTSK